MNAPPHAVEILPPDGTTETSVRALAPRLPAANVDPFTFPPFADEADNAAPAVAALVRQVDDAAEALRAWPDLAFAPKPRADVKPPTAQDPWRALEARRQQIVDLQKVRETQHAALERARDEIVGLNNTVELLRAWLAQREQRTASTQQTQARLEAENAALRVEREQADTNFAELLRQTAELRAAFEEQEKEMAVMRARVAALKQELAAKPAGEDNLAAAIAEAKARYYRDFDKRTAQFEAETEKLARALGAREERVRTLEDENAQLAARCDGLERTAADFEAANRAAQEHLESQTAKVEFLDAALQAERESSGRKIAELAAELQRERLARRVEAHEAATVRREIGKLLLRLAAEPEPAGEQHDSGPVAGAAANDPIAPPTAAAS